MSEPGRAPASLALTRTHRRSPVRVSAKPPAMNKLITPCTRRQSAGTAVLLGRRFARTGRYEIGPGLTDAEFARIERDYDFEFADDHRAFLAAGLPLNRPPQTGQTWARPWPNWRDGDPGDLRRQLGWPVEGALFDVEHNALWHPPWGPRPARTGKALKTARQHLRRAPKMIPVYGHRYLPAGRGTYGHPVLSIYQTDIIFYGTDLADYIGCELDGRSASADWTPPPLVPFWSEFL